MNDSELNYLEMAREILANLPAPNVDKKIISTPSDDDRIAAITFIRILSNAA